MKPVTVYIMKSDNGFVNIQRLLFSIGDVVECHHVLEGRDLANAVKSCETEWYMYLFSNEYLSDVYKQLLPELLDSKYGVDVWMFFERDNDAGDSVVYGRSPRLFKSHIELNGMIPLKTDGLNMQWSVDGFVERDGGMVNAKV